MSYSLPATAGVPVTFVVDCGTETDIEGQLQLALRYVSRSIRSIDIY